MNVLEWLDRIATGGLIVFVWLSLVVILMVVYGRLRDRQGAAQRDLGSVPLTLQRRAMLNDSQRRANKERGE